MNGSRYLVGVVVVGILACGSASAQMVELTTSRDNTLYEDAGGSLSLGAGGWFFAGRTNNNFIRRGLIHFDVAGNVPAGAVIDSVTLELYMFKTIAGSTDVSLHVVSADWGEGTSNNLTNPGQGGPSSTGDATWIHTFYDTVFWTSVGGDFNPVASAVQSVGGPGYYSWSTSQMVSDCQVWLDDPSQEFGWIVIGEESSGPATTKRFSSREYPLSSQHPTLTITYTLNGLIFEDDFELGNTSEWSSAVP